MNTKSKMLCHPMNIPKKLGNQLEEMFDHIEHTLGYTHNSLLQN